MAANIARRDKIIISKTVNPEYRQVLKTYAHLQKLEIVEIEDSEGATDLEELKKT